MSFIYFQIDGDNDSQETSDFGHGLPLHHWDLRTDFFKKIGIVTTKVAVVTSGRWAAATLFFQAVSAHLPEVT
jgi:hypothetical protein